MKITVLEKSTNTHQTKSDVKVITEEPTMTTIELETKGKMIVEHGHHHVVSTEPETKKVVKITQQEFNPLLNKFQNAFD